MAIIAHITMAVAAFVHAGQASKMFPECVAGTKNVWMPSAESGNCFCGGTTPKMCQPFPEYLGLNRALCDRESPNFAIGSVSDSGMICGFFCLCENATWTDEKLDNVQCCRAGTKVGLQNHTVTAPEAASTTKPLKAEDFLPMPSSSIAASPIKFIVLIVAALGVACQ